MLKRIFNISLFLTMPVILWAQSPKVDTTLELSQVEIRDDRVDMFAKGLVYNKLDSISRSENAFKPLSEILSNSTSIYIKTYGQGGVATISFRGTSSNHTGLIWNGMRINPPNIGYLDLSLIDNSFFQHVSILHGGAGPMYGSGMIGGSIHLGTDPVFRKKTSVSVGGMLGSFSAYDGAVKAIFSGAKVYSSTAVSGHSSINDFPYTDLNGERQKLSNAAIQRYGIMQDIALKTGENHYLQASLWYNYADRQIPPTLTTARSEASLTDRAARVMLQWRRQAEKSSYSVRMAYYNEFENYTDPQFDIVSNINTQTYLSQLEGNFIVLKNSKFLAGASYEYDLADIDAYNGPRDQHDAAVYASWLQLFPKAGWQLALNMRTEFITGFQVPLLPSVGVEGRIGRNFKVRFNASRNFRAPTMNERYWIPGGNPALKPETSWNQEAGVTYHAGKEHFKNELTVTFYSSVVDNWILWIPVESFWTAENVQKVWARGIEIQAKQSLQPGKVRVLLAEGYTLSISTNEKKISENDASYKKQLIYTPLHRLFVRLNVMYAGFEMMIRQNFTSLAYTTRDNEEYVPGFATTDISVGKKFKFNKAAIDIWAVINNLFDAQYQVIRYRQMPGRNFAIRILFYINS